MIRTMTATIIVPVQNQCLQGAEMCFNIVFSFEKLTNGNINFPVVNLIIDMISCYVVT